MLDREGFRPNVGIILVNQKSQVWWGKRVNEHSWQFPQGGIKYGESPEQAMFRELHEEIGLKPEHVKILGRTRDWLRYEVPDRFIKREIRGHYRGQKQIWYLLRMSGRDSDVSLRTTDHPEFDAWRWQDYWVPLDSVIEFKRDVYSLALNELARFVFRGKRGDLIKVLWWDGHGLCLFCKRLERGRFVWPQATAGGIHLSAAQLSMLLEGIDWRRPLRTHKPTQV